MNILRWLISLFSGNSKDRYDTGQDPPYPRDPDKPKKHDK